MKIASEEKKVPLKELKEISQKMYGNLVKAVVDIEKKLMVYGAKLHSDEEKYLLENGSKQENLWGINLYPDKYPKEEWIEIDSIINIRPHQGNFSRTVKNSTLRKKIIEITNKLCQV